MTKPEIEAFFAAMEAALSELPCRAIPVDADGKHYEIQFTHAHHVPADLAELLSAAGQIGRLRTMAESHGCGFVVQVDGSIDITN